MLRVRSASTWAGLLVTAVLLCGGALPRPGSAFARQAEPPFPQPEAALGSGQISGVVTRADTGLPLECVTVWVYDLEGFFVAFVDSDASGAYTISGLLPGDYKVFFEPPGNYIPEWYEGQPDFSRAASVQVRDGGTTAGIDAALEVGGRITGQVTADESGLPLPAVDVWVYDSQGDPCGSAETGPDGVYSIDRLRSGSYRLQFIPKRDGPAADYVAEAYDDQADLQTANPIAITAPEALTGIDAALARGGKITGLVTAEASGAPLADVSILVYQQGDPYPAYATTNASGLYTIAGLGQGTYKLEFAPYEASADYMPEFYNDRPDLLSADGIPVAPPNTVEHIDASLARGGKISGRVTALDTGLPMQDASVRLLDQDGRELKMTWTGPGGDYTFNQLANGSYYILFDPPSDCRSADYLPEYFNDQPTLEQADAIPLTAMENVKAVNASLEAGLPTTPDRFLYFPLIDR